MIFVISFAGVVDLVLVALMHTSANRGMLSFAHVATKVINKTCFSMVSVCVTFRLIPVQPVDL